MKFIILLAIVFVGCTSTDSDVTDPKKEAALQAIKRDVPSTDYFEVIKWHPVDTLSTWPDPSVKTAIRYKVDFDYKNKSGVVLNKYGIAIFNEKDSVLNSIISDRKD